MTEYVSQRELGCRLALFENWFNYEIPLGSRTDLRHPAVQQMFRPAAVNNAKRLHAGEERKACMISPNPALPGNAPMSDAISNVRWRSIPG